MTFLRNASIQKLLQVCSFSLKYIYILKPFPLFFLWIANYVMEFKKLKYILFKKKKTARAQEVPLLCSKNGIIHTLQTLSLTTPLLMLQQNTPHRFFSSQPFSHNSPGEVQWRQRADETFTDVGRVDLYEPLQWDAHLFLFWIRFFYQIVQHMLLCHLGYTNEKWSKQKTELIQYCAERLLVLRGYNPVCLIWRTERNGLDSVQKLRPRGRAIIWRCFFN